MSLTKIPHVIVPASHLLLPAGRTLALGVLMFLCGIAWGWNLFRNSDTAWIGMSYLNFGAYVCDYQLDAVAALEDHYYLFRCSDGTVHKKRVMLTKGWRKLTYE